MTEAALLEAPTLSAAERGRLADLEAVIDRGLATFVETGEALLEIKAGNLYRHEYATFAGYLRQRWGLSTSRGQQLMTTAHVQRAIVQNGGEAPAASEFSLRQLGPVLRSQGTKAVAEAWEGIRERHGNRPSAAKVRGAVADAGAVPYAGQSGRRTSIASVGEGLATARTRLGRLLAELAGRRLGEEARGRAAELAETALLLAADLTALSRLPMQPDELCLRHGVERDSAGICVACRRADLTASERAGEGRHPRRR